MYKIEIVWYEFQYILTNNFVFDIFQLRFRFFFFIVPRSWRSSSKQKISIRVPHFRFGFDANLRELYDDHMLQRQEASRGGALIETRFDSLIFFLFLLFRKKTLSFDLIQLITMSTCLLIKSPIHSLFLSLSTLPDQFLEELSMSISDIRRQIFIYIYIFLYIYFFLFCFKIDASTIETRDRKSTRIAVMIITIIITTKIRAMYIISVQSTCTCMCKIAQLHFSSFLRYFFFLSLSLFLSLVLFAENRDREREREREREKMRFYIYILLSLHLHSHVTSFFSFFFILFLSSLFLSLCVCVYVCVCIIVYVNKRLLLKAAPQIEIVIPGSKKEK